MTSMERVYRRVLRRETHRARTAPAVVAAVVAGLLLAAALTAVIWVVIDPARQDAGAAVIRGALEGVDLTSVSIGLGVLALAMAVVLLCFAASPGRLARRSRLAGRTALLVDDGVLADAIAERVARHCALDVAQVAVTVGRRAVRVRVQPSSGLPVDRHAVQAAASEVLSATGFDATVTATVSHKGVLA